MDNWQKNIGYVSQNVFLLDDTIKNNIALGVDEENFDKNLFKKCLKDTSLDEFVSDLFDKENTFIGEMEQEYLMVKNKKLV